MHANFTPIVSLFTRRPEHRQLQQRSKTPRQRPVPIRQATTSRPISTLAGGSHRARISKTRGLSMAMVSKSGLPFLKLEAWRSQATQSHSQKDTTATRGQTAQRRLRHAGHYADSRQPHCHHVPDMARWLDCLLHLLACTLSRRFAKCIRRPCYYTRWIHGLLGDIVDVSKARGWFISCGVTCCQGRWVYVGQSCGGHVSRAGQGLPILCKARKLHRPMRLPEQKTPGYVSEPCKIARLYCCCVRLLF